MFRSEGPITPKKVYKIFLDFQNPLRFFGDVFPRIFRDFLGICGIFENFPDFFGILYRFLSIYYGFLQIFLGFFRDFL